MFLICQYNLFLFSPHWSLSSNNLLCSGPLGPVGSQILSICHDPRLRSLTFSPGRNGKLSYYLVFIPTKKIWFVHLNAENTAMIRKETLNNDLGLTSILEIRALTLLSLETVSVGEEDDEIQGEKMIMMVMISATA